LGIAFFVSFNTFKSLTGKLKQKKPTPFGMSFSLQSSAKIDDCLNRQKYGSPKAPFS
jgi:hypothetical protein